MAGAKRIDIQWLRALAAIEVIAWHSDLLVKHFSDHRLAGTWWYQPFGGVGVELFFILSGYVICMRAPTFSSGGAFLLSRIRRLFPMYWIFTSLVVLTYVLNPAWRLGDFDPGFWSLAQSYLILPQWNRPILSVGWTLEHEMMFYLVVALAVMLLREIGPAKIAVAWGLAALGFIGCLREPGPESLVWVHHVFSPYMFAFAIGWLLRCLEELNATARLWNLVLFVAAGALAYWMSTEIGDRLLPRIALVALLFVAFAACRDLFEADNALNRLGSKIGDASYSVYLCHWFVLSVIGKVLGILQPPAGAVELVRVSGIVLSIVIGVAIFYVLERPIDRWLRKTESASEISWPRLFSLWRQSLPR